eukprot:2746651-Alexandrium_andersonii.AAC.1
MSSEVATSSSSLRLRASPALRRGSGAFLDLGRNGARGRCRLRSRRRRRDCRGQRWSSISRVLAFGSCRCGRPTGSLSLA